MITRRGIDALRYEIAVLRMLLHEVEPEPMLNKKMIHERGHRAMNNRLEENTAKRMPGQRRRSPRKVVQPATDDVVTLRLDARTVVKTKKGYALQKWMEQYPNAVVV